MIVSVSLDKVSEKIFKKCQKTRHYGWFSKDVQEMLKGKYGTDKQCIVNEINELDKQEKVIWKRKQELAKKINKLK